MKKKDRAAGNFEAAAQKAPRAAADDPAEGPPGARAAPSPVLPGATLPRDTADGEAAVPPELGGQKLDGLVRRLFAVSWGRARQLVETGKVFVDGAPITWGEAPVRAGSTVSLRLAAKRPSKGGLPREAVVFFDAHVVVVAKPAGISTVPFDENERGTLDELVRALLEKPPFARPGQRGRANLGVVHRIDKETTGLLVFTRTWLAKQSLTAQFRSHTVHRRYLALVHGQPQGGTLRSHLVADRGDGLRGSAERRPQGRHNDGQLAVTHVEVLERYPAASLVACRLETGRTHQIRVHLSEAGHSLLGERVYNRGFRGEELSAPRLMLHAAELGFVHPATERPMRFDLPLPDDMERVRAELA